MKRAYPALNRPSEGYVFVVTYGRSGSTLLQSLLNEIDGYCIRGENENALFHLMQSWYAVANSEPMRGARQAGRVLRRNDPWFGAERIDPDHFAKALADFFVREVLQPDPGLRVSGFKEIRFHDQPALFAPYLNFMRRFFPKARFIFNTRNHDAVCKSGWWATMNPVRVKAQLVAAEKLFDGYIANHPDCTIKLHYDNYVADRTRLGRLFDFLGEPYDAALVDRVMDLRLEHLKLGTDSGVKAPKKPKTAK